MRTDEIKIFCPATVANISCGFDVLGLALNTIGDEMIVRKVSDKGVTITKITGQDLPLKTNENVAGVAAEALLSQYNSPHGFQIEIKKIIKPGSGIGSSAASAAGAVWAINKLMGSPFSIRQLIPFAMEGERLASGTAHADNVTPALLGGITLVRSQDPLDIVNIHIPKELYVAVVHPKIEIKTSDSRNILKSSISLSDGIKQWGNLAGLIAGLYQENYDLIGRSLVDHIVEPTRSILIPGFAEVKLSALGVGALGCGISGSGPSIFALSKGKIIAENVAVVMSETYKKLGIDHDVHVSDINLEGIRVIK